MMLEEGTWRAVAAGEQFGWEWRSRLIAKHVRPGDVVFDFGAGNRKLARFIPPNCSYVPIDAVDVLPGAFVADYNKEFILPDNNMSVGVCAGFLEYISDVPEFFNNLSAVFPGSTVIFSYLFSDEVGYRSRMSFLSRYDSLESLLKSVERYLSYVCVISSVNDTYIVRATLGSYDMQKNSEPWSDLRPVDDIFNTSWRRRALRKMANSILKIKNFTR